MGRYSSLIVLIPAAVLLGLGTVVFTNNALTYFAYVNAQEKADSHYCDGVRCFCNNLQCITKDEREKEFLDLNLIGTAFVVPAAIMGFLFHKR